MGRVGIDHDVVRLTLNDDTVLVAESYEVALSILTQPCAFAIRLGSDRQAKDLIKKYPSGTRFSLSIDGALQFSGTTDGYTLEGTAGGTEVTIRGRDALKPLHDAYIESEESFLDVTYRQLVEKVLERTTPKPWVLNSSNAANRKVISKSARAGATSKLDQLSPVLIGAIAGALSEEGTNLDDPADFLAFAEVHPEIAQALVGGNLGGKPTTGGGTRALQAKIGERWFGSFLKAELDRAGLMLWATADRNFVLATPATDGLAVARIYRKRSGINNIVTPKSAAFKNETTGRYAECVVHYRSGGGKKSRFKGYGSFVDQEMVDLGYKHKLVVKDDKCKTLAQADFLARKRIADTRRAGWQLSYTVPGHTTIGLDNTRIVWSDDVIVEVDDDEFDIHGEFYVESVTHRSSPEKHTVLSLMRKADVIFGEELA